MEGGEGEGCGGVTRGVSNCPCVGCDASFWGVARNESCKIFTLNETVCSHLLPSACHSESVGNSLAHCVLNCNNSFLFVVSS
jgi:hypothetical protein